MSLNSRVGAKIMLLILAAITSLSVQAQQEPEPVQLGYLFSDSQMPVTLAAYRELLEQEPQLEGKIQLSLISESLLDDVNPGDVANLDVLVINVHDEHLMAQFEEQHGVNIIDQVSSTGDVIIVGQGLRPLEEYQELDIVWDETARALWEYSGVNNRVGVMRFALNHAGFDLEVPEPIPGLNTGYYYPTEAGGEVFADWSSFEAWMREQEKWKEGVPRLAVGFYRSDFYSRDTSVLDAVIAEVENKGAMAVPYFGYPAHLASHDLLLDEEGIARADAILSFIFRFAQPDSSGVLSELNLPIISLITLYGRSEQEWRESATGLSLFEGTFQIAGPELGGLVAPTVVGTRERVFDEVTGIEVVQKSPIAERITRAVERGLAYVNLQSNLNADKKLALIYYNYPPGRAAIGASYLNVAESISQVLLRLQAEGYDLGASEATDLSTEEILERMTTEAFNVGGYAPGELEQLVAQGSAVNIPVTQYRDWLNQMEPSLSEKVVSDWGEPSESNLMAVGSGDSLAFILPSIQLGNIMLMPQPARGWGEDNEQLYHAADLAPPHQYVAAYKWLQNEYEADAVVHIGTHGTLEWLDGKDTGLSDEDAPEALIADMPDLYIYNVDVVGEGLVARRRGAAALVDHMVPPFVEGGLYAELAQLGELINSYHTNLTKNPELAEVYAEEIRMFVDELGISKDLGLNLVSFEEGRAMGLEVDAALDHDHSNAASSAENSESDHTHDHDHSHEHSADADHNHDHAADHSHDEYGSVVVTHEHDGHVHTHGEQHSHEDMEDVTLQPAQIITHELIHVLQDYIASLKEENIPYGLHTFGEAPEDEARASTVAAVVNTDRSLLPNAAVVMTEEMDQRILNGAQRELDNLMLGLSGGYLVGGNGGEPIRNPDAYPTGKNFYGIDPDKVPMKASWNLGVRLADQMLEEHLAEHGKYPEKVSFIIWGNETLRHEGVLESQIFWLLGTRPIWNDYDKVVDVEVIPSAQLGRPRVDIVISSAAEGMFYNVTSLIDKAVQKVKAIEEADNFVRQHYLQTREALIGMGYSEEDADARAGVRIFDEPPGIYNLNINRIAEASGTWDSDVGMAHDYFKKMGHGFGNGFWGEPMEDVFRLALEGSEKVVHSSSTMLYGALDNDDFYMYAGGLVNAIKHASDGVAPDLVVTNTRDPDDPDMTDMDEFLGKEMRSRYVNPTWIEGMQAEGYAGAGEMRAFVEYLWGWDATVTELVDDRMWQESFEVYVEDKHEMDMQAFFDEYSPFAFQDISARMLEVVRKEYWDADQQTVQTLLQEYLESVQRHGVGCSDVSCGNARLLEFVRDEATRLGLDTELIENFTEEMEEVTGGSITELAAQLREFSESNEQRIRDRNALVEQGQAPEAIEGLRMEEIEQNQPQAVASPDNQEQDTRIFLILAALLIASLIFWRYRVSNRIHKDA